MEKLERYLVELRRPELGWPQLDAVAGRAREAAGKLTRLGRPVRFLRSVYVPEDGTCVFLYEGRSAADVRLAAEALDIGVDRLVQTVRVERMTDERAASAGDAAAAATTIDLSVERVSEVLQAGPAEARETTS